MGQQEGWKVPAFITLDSPLAIHAVNQLLPSIGMPQCASTWYNVRDPKDTATLLTLGPDPLPPISASPRKTPSTTALQATTGIEKYLRDADVSRWIYASLTN
jgi:hypothetical protein